MRLVARRRGCPYAVTEALLDTIMLSGGLGLKKSIDINDEDHPVAGQVIGSEPATVAPAAAILHEAGYDVVDLNFACPVKKIKNKARGGHMLRDLPRGLAILRAVRERLPTATLTVSLRRSFGDDGHEILYALLDEAWQLGYAAARVHARTVEQKYFGRADWSALAEIKRQYPTRTILGSGDVFTAEDAVRMKRETNVDVVWIARGAIGNPWIFRHAAELLRVGARHASPANANVGVDADTADRATQASPLQNPIAPPSVVEQRDALREHWDESISIHGEQVTGRRMRKQGIKYARFHPDAAEVKREFVSVASVTDWSRVLDRWYAVDRPGVWPAPDAADEVNDEKAAGCGIGENG